MLRTHLSRSRKASRSERRSFRPHIESLEDRSVPSVTLSGVPDWQAEGPAPIFGGQAEGINADLARAPNAFTNPVAGAINAVAADPGDANRIFVGTVNGGVWRTLNATSGNPTWTPLTDQLPSLAISDIKFSPLDRHTLFAGIGQFSSRGGMPGVLTGVLRSTDNGDTWQQLGTSTFAGVTINSIVPTALGGDLSHQVVLAATSQGVYRSSDGGVNWRLIPVLASPGSVAAAASELVADPGNLLRYYVGLPGQGVFRSTDRGATWQPVFTGLTTTTRIRLSVQNNPLSRNNVVYAAFITGGSPNAHLIGIWHSENFGDIWTSMPLPGDISGDLHPGGQADNNFSILAHPTLPYIVFVGGDRQIAGPATPITGAINDTGRLFRGDTRLSPPATWASIVNFGAHPDLPILGYPLPNIWGSGPHADSRNMVFDANGNILEVDDGGIYRLVHPDSDAPFRYWESPNGNLQITEMTSIAYDSLNDRLIGGAQDVGSSVQSGPGNLVWGSDLARQGDGGFVAVDPSENDDLGSFSIHYTTGAGLNGFQRRTFRPIQDAIPVLVNLLVEGSNGLDLVGAGSMPGASGNVFDNTIGFYNPYVLNTVDPTRMLVGTQFLYESFNRGNNVFPIGGLSDLNTDGLDNDGNGHIDDGKEFAPQRNFGQIAAMVYGGHADLDHDGLLESYADVAWLGTSSGVFLRTAALSSPGVDNFVQLTAYPGRAVRDIAVDPTDFRRAYVLDGTNVWRTNDAGVNWFNMTGDLTQLLASMNLPFNMSKIVIYKRPSPPGGDDVIFVGGIGGVFRTLDPRDAVPHWTKFGQGLPNALVTDLQVDSADDHLFVATLGRGVWAIPSFSTVAATPSSLVVDGDDGGPRDDEIALVRDGANPLLLDVFVNPASGRPDLSIPFALFNRITVNGGGGNDRLVVDLSNGTFIPSDGLTFNGGDQTGAPGDRLDLRGTATTMVTYLPSPTDPGSGTLLVNGGTINFTGLEPISLSTARGLFFQTPNSLDRLTIDNPTFLSTRIAGTSGGVPFESITFDHVSYVTIDTGANDGADGDDRITMPNGLFTNTLGFFLSTGSGSDTLIMGGPVVAGTATFDGGPGVDHIIARGDYSYVVTDRYIRWSPLGELRLLNVIGESLDVTGGPSANEFNLRWSGDLGIDGGEGGDHYVISWPGPTGNVRIQDTGKSGTDQAVINGTVGKDAFDISSSQTGLGKRTVSYDSALEGLFVNGLGGDDTFRLRPSADTVITVDGGTALTQDALVYDASSLEIKPEPGMITAVGYQPVFYKDIENLTILPVTQVVSAVINDGSAQRSQVTSITITFSGIVTLDDGAVEVIQSQGGKAGLTLTSAAGNGQTMLTITFGGQDLVNGSLGDGRYRLLLHADKIHDWIGQPLDGDHNGLAGGDYANAFFRLFGDVNGDGLVNRYDLASFQSALGSKSGDAAYLWFLDYDGNGVIDKEVDLYHFMLNYGKRV
jgi:hypothetical protein